MRNLIENDKEYFDDKNRPSYIEELKKIYKKFSENDQL